ncbi:MAG: leucine-rich repeat domain-containing protein [Oscillospiraceae bacterium]|nr:leucine-rich repeat domain-containing protein [Oscillospiraceae bacterium]
MKKINLLKRILLLCLSFSFMGFGTFSGTLQVFADDSTDTIGGVLDQDDWYWEWEIKKGVLTVTLLGSRTDWPLPPIVGDKVEEIWTPPWEDYAEQIVEVVFTEGFTEIGSYAFNTDLVRNGFMYEYEGYLNLRKVTLPKTLETINECAFYNAISLDDVNFTELTNLESIGGFAFAESKISVLDLSKTQVTSIGNSAFASTIQVDIMTPLDEVRSLEEVGSLEKVILPVTIEKIGAGAFSCVGLFYYGGGGRTQTYEQGSLKTITYPGAPGGGREGLYEFPPSLVEFVTRHFGGVYEVSYAFQGQRSVEVDLSKTKIRHLPVGVFSYNYSLSKVTLPDYEKFTVLENAFGDTRQLHDFFIPPTVIEIKGLPADRGTYLFVEPGSYAETWVRGIYDEIFRVERKWYTWFYRASPEVLKEPPPPIYQYIPFEFVFNTGVTQNRNMIFEIEFGENGDEPLPDWLTFEAVGFDYTTLEFDENDVPINLPDEYHLPGTLHGVFTDLNEIQKYNGTPFKITAYPLNYVEQDNPHRYKDRYSVSVEFTLQLEEHPDDYVATGEFNFKDDGTLGDEEGNIILDDDGNVVEGSTVMYLDAPFSENDETSWYFEGFFINGERMEQGVDYTAEEGSTIVTIRDQTFASLGTGTNTATATFRRADGDSGVDLQALTNGNAWDIRLEAISQSFTLRDSSYVPNQPQDPDSNDPDQPQQPQNPRQPQTPQQSQQPQTPQEPQNPNPNPNTQPQPQPQSPEYIYFNDEIILEALKDENPVIDLSETETDSKLISADMLQAIAESGKDVEIVLENGFTYTILADSITPEARAFYLNVDIYFTNDATTIDGVAISANSIVIDPNFLGEFGFDIKITFTAEQLRENGIIDGNNVSLFHIDHNGNVTDLGKVGMNPDGSVEFTINHASYYVLAEAAPEGAILLPPQQAPEPQSSDNKNPPTGVTTGLANAILSGTAVTFITIKKRKFRKKGH